MEQMPADILHIAPTLPKTFLSEYARANAGGRVIKDIAAAERDPTVSRVIINGISGIPQRKGEGNFRCI